MSFFVAEIGSLPRSTFFAEGRPRFRTGEIAIVVKVLISPARGEAMTQSAWKGFAAGAIGGAEGTLVLNVFQKVLLMGTKASRG